MADERIEVIPLKNGSWKVVDTEGSKESFDDRASAVEHARELAGVEPLFNRNGDVVAKSQAHTKVVLLRVDGSDYGELEAAITEGGTPQRVSIQPATEQGEAVKRG